MWNFVGIPVSGAWLNPEPVRVLYDLDGPRIFICEDTKGDSFLVYQCGEDDTCLRFLVVPFGAALEQQLTSGAINLRDALFRHRAWVFDLAKDWQVCASWKVDVDNLPASVLPQPGVMLWRHLQPRARQFTIRSYADETTLPPVWVALVTGIASFLLISVTAAFPESFSPRVFGPLACVCLAIAAFVLWKKEHLARVALMQAYLSPLRRLLETGRALRDLVGEPLDSSIRMGVLDVGRWDDGVQQFLNTHLLGELKAYHEAGTLKPSPNESDLRIFLGHKIRALEGILLRNALD